MTMANLTIPNDWQVFDDAEQLAEKLTETILKCAECAIEKHGAFHFITAGGTTPNRCYQLLSIADADWSKWHIYMGDERVLHFVDEERNSQALLNNWISQIRMPPQQVHFINTEAGGERSAHAYAEIIESVDEFDLCLLGMGEDGHTASLFPGHKGSTTVEEIVAEKSKQDCAPVIFEHDSPKPPAERVSLNYCAFKKCREVYKLVTGESKQTAVQSWLNGNTDLPIKVVEGKQTHVWISQDALPSSL